MFKGTSPNTPASQKVSILSLRRDSGVKTLTKDPSVAGPSLLDAVRQSAANAAKPDDPSNPAVPLSPKATSLEAAGGNRSLLMRRDSGGVRTIVKNSPTSTARSSLLISSSPSSRVTKLDNDTSSNSTSQDTLPEPLNATIKKEDENNKGEGETQPATDATTNVDKTFDQIWEQLAVPDDKPKEDAKDDPFWANLLAEPLPTDGPNPFEDPPSVTPLDTTTPIASSAFAASNTIVNTASPTPSPTSPESLTSVDMPASAASAQAALEALLSPQPLSDNERDDPVLTPVSPAPPQPSPPPSPTARRSSATDSFSSAPPRSPRMSVTTIVDTRPNRSMDSRRPSRVGAPPLSPSSSSSSAFSFSTTSTSSSSSTVPLSPTARSGAVSAAPTSPTARSPSSSLTTSRSRALSSPSRSTLPSSTPRSPSRSSVSGPVPKSPTASSTISSSVPKSPSSSTSTLPRSPSSANTSLASSAASVTASSLLAATSTTLEEKKQPEQQEDLTEEASDTVSAVVPRSRAFSSPAAATKPPISPRFSFLATLPEIKPKVGYENKACQADEFDGMAPSYGQLQSENISLVEENARLKAIIASLQATVGKSGSSSPSSSPASRSPRSRPPPPPPSEAKPLDLNSVGKS